MASTSMMESRSICPPAWANPSVCVHQPEIIELESVEFGTAACKLRHFFLLFFVTNIRALNSRILYLCFHMLHASPYLQAERIPQCVPNRLSESRNVCPPALGNPAWRAVGQEEPPFGNFQLWRTVSGTLWFLFPLSLCISTAGNGAESTTVWQLPALTNSFGNFVIFAFLSLYLSLSLFLFSVPCIVCVNLLIWSHACVLVSTRAALAVLS